MTKEQKEKALAFLKDMQECTYDGVEEIRTAIEYLEREPCEDCVSRQAVIDGINKYFHDEYYQRTSIQDCRDCLIEDVIKNLPSVTPTQEWIPVSERLPKEEGDYLLWGKVCEDEEEYPFIGSYDSGCEQFGVWQEQFDKTTLGCLGSEFFEYASVIAWMPLPKPYKAEMESEDGNQRIQTT